jgi:hypothetical protein
LPLPESVRLKAESALETLQDYFNEKVIPR